MKKINIILLIFIICLSVAGCEKAGLRENDNEEMTVAVNEVTETESVTEYVFQENEVKNSLFQDYINECTSINYWILGEAVAITDAQSKDQILNILSSVTVTKKEDFENDKAGGIFLDLVNENGETSLMFIGNYICIGEKWYEADGCV